MRYYVSSPSSFGVCRRSAPLDTFVRCQVSLEESRCHDNMSLTTSDGHLTVERQSSGVFVVSTQQQVIALRSYASSLSHSHRT
jgi:hypothetical protein